MFQYCQEHKTPDMINIVLENKCSVLECSENYEFIIDNTKYCFTHSPEEYETNIKRLCKYCDIKDHSKHICSDCNKIKHKKEWAIVRYIKKNIDYPFIYDSSKMLNGCSKKRPDIYYKLNKHCVIVEIDENQHKRYDEICECSRICEIVSGIGGKSVIMIRYNPDSIKHNGKIKKINNTKRLELLINTINQELTKTYDEFIVKLIQLYYDDNYELYQDIKVENITDLVCI